MIVRKIVEQFQVVDKKTISIHFFKEDRMNLNVLNDICCKYGGCCFNVEYVL